MRMIAYCTRFELNELIVKLSPRKIMRDGVIVTNTYIAVERFPIPLHK